MGDRLSEMLGRPTSEDLPLWRYMDFTKYVWLLDQKCLYFARSDQLDDPFEGSTPRFNITIRPQVYADAAIPEQLWGQLSTASKEARTWVFLNCWHACEHESAAMWKLYARTNEAIAIQTTYRHLRSCLPDNVHLGVVRYIDYDREWMPEGNLFYPFLHKRKSFEHEREIRAIVMAFPSNPDSQAGIALGEVGRAVDVALDRLIQQVRVAPSAPTWFLDLTKAATQRYGFAFSVARSRLDEQPVF